MSLFLTPLLITVLLGLGTAIARMAMNRLHLQLLRAELGGRSYDTLSEFDKDQLNQAVNMRFHAQTVGGKLATFVLLYAYPFLYVSQHVFGRSSWRTAEVIVWSSLFYYTLLIGVGYTAQRLSSLSF